MKLLGHMPGLPGNVKSFYIVPLDPAHSAGPAGHLPVKRTILFFARGHSRYRFVGGSTGLDRDPTLNNQRIPLQDFLRHPWRILKSSCVELLC